MVTRTRILAKCKDPNCDQREAYFTAKDMVYAGGLPYCDQCDGEMTVTAIEANEHVYDVTGSIEPNYQY